MTRINFGIEPAELCDQHLIAEYRELPRAFRHRDKHVPGPFRLGKGHELWCSQFPGSLAARYRSLVAEMHYRGFHVSNPEPRRDGAHAAPGLLAGARPIVQARIADRLGTMRRAPRWTRRTVPPWARHGDHDDGIGLPEPVVRSVNVSPYSNAIG